jgi:hypothetical protein
MDDGGGCGSSCTCICSSGGTVGGSPDYAISASFLSRYSRDRGRRLCICEGRPGPILSRPRTQRMGEPDPRVLDSLPRNDRLDSGARYGSALRIKSSVCAWDVLPLGVSIRVEG